MFREDSQIDFAKENVILNVSLRPSLRFACTFHFKTDSQFMCKLRLSAIVNVTLVIDTKLLLFTNR